MVTPLCELLKDAKYPEDKEPIGIYIHVPFCKNRCNYCDFVSSLYKEENGIKYLNIVKKEIEWHLQKKEFAEKFRNAQVDTLYFGGGTPSILKSNFFEEISHLCRSSFRFLPDAEITIEINPESANLSELMKLKQLGFNRASLGVQSFDDEELKRMNRAHSREDAVRAASIIREAEFKNFSIDLITGYPGQTKESITGSMERLLSLKPEHTSVYRLEMKHGSHLEYQIETGEIPPIDEEQIESFYKIVYEMLTQNGYKRYEMSSFAKPGFACQHNLKFWKDRVFLGFGAGAQGMTGNIRYANMANVASYSDAVEYGQPPYVSYKKVTPQMRFKIALIMGSYLVEGVNLVSLSNRYNVDALAFIKNSVGSLVDEGLVEITEDNIFHITDSGRADLNRIFCKWS
ncbi:MAG: radical SAM family heme chaperone HemW [Candidatus Brocadiae bacterium]|nr:radical SAM family heme chaperone HemW [Candidatus Brocadiia bacterium]